MICPASADEPQRGFGIGPRCGDDQGRRQGIGPRVPEEPDFGFAERGEDEHRGVGPHRSKYGAAAAPGELELRGSKAGAFERPDKAFDLDSGFGV